MCDYNNDQDSMATFSVSTDVLKEMSDSVKGSIDSLKKQFENMKNVVNNSKNYWSGKAGNKHRSCYEKCIKSTDEICKRMSEHITDLQTMAGIYEEAESSAIDQADGLLTDVLEQLPTDMIS